MDPFWNKIQEIVLFKMPDFISDSKLTDSSVIRNWLIHQSFLIESNFESIFLLSSEKSLQKDMINKLVPSYASLQPSPWDKSQLVKLLENCYYVERLSPGDNLCRRLNLRILSGNGRQRIKNFQPIEKDDIVSPDEGNL